LTASNAGASGQSCIPDGEQIASVSPSDFGGHPEDDWFDFYRGLGIAHTVIAVVARQWSHVPLRAHDLTSIDRVDYPEDHDKMESVSGPAQALG
jgi:hypothetical protein